MKTCLLISFYILLVGCYDPKDYEDIEFNPDSDSKIMFLSAELDSLPADGKSVVEFAAFVSKDVRPEFREIEFVTNRGIFIASGAKTIKVKAQNFDPSNNDRIMAIAQLRSDPAAGVAIITAKVKNFELSDTIKFYRVFASDISLETSRFYITQSLMSEDTVYSTISRTIGVPTSGQSVEFFVLNNLGDTIINTVSGEGYYRSHARFSDEKGLSSFIFSMGDNQYLGKLKILGVAQIPNNLVLKDSTYIEVIN